MDARFKTSEGNFNYRVGAIILKENKLLVMKEPKAGYYYIPGGGVQLFETTESAILREIKEELEVDVKIDRLLWINQNFYLEETNNQKYHELCFYYLIDISNTYLEKTSDIFYSKEKGNNQELVWIDIDTIDNQYLYPVFLKDAIKEIPSNIEVIFENRV